ncbi:hypothetical protein LDFHOB_03545 [Candidatus Electronema aureum]
MNTIQWRPAVNALTVPPSYKILFVPRNIAGYPEIAAEVAAENPNWNEELVEAVMRAEPQDHSAAADQRRPGDAGGCLQLPHLFSGQIGRARRPAAEPRRPDSGQSPPFGFLHARNPPCGQARTARA